MLELTSNVSVCSLCVHCDPPVSTVCPQTHALCVTVEKRARSCVVNEFSDFRGKSLPACWKGRPTPLGRHCPILCVCLSLSRCRLHWTDTATGSWSSAGRRESERWSSPQTPFKPPLLHLRKKKPLPGCGCLRLTDQKSRTGPISLSFPLSSSRIGCKSGDGKLSDLFCLSTSNIAQWETESLMEAQEM